ncbi:Osmotin, thaumatin-like protein [Rickenella mellea]|uniref:Osmotin, thaumatin-like protein n=1 Tax=Rickenella mellea TaxID=50990 RepID=A0A4Y7QJ97_9AGAM|nr:Osmotin, thaumatin-like protein [Rickenella mellea]
MKTVSQSGVLAPAIIWMLASLPAVRGKTMTVKNNCPYTIWPGMYTNPHQDPGFIAVYPDHTTGWEAPPGNTVTFNVPVNWTNGRIWGRQNCNFNKRNGHGFFCDTGDCSAGLVCDQKDGDGQTPATLAEFTFGGLNNTVHWDGRMQGPFNDFYDISLVDGFNLPMRITLSEASCKSPDCSANVNDGCPPQLLVKNDTGSVVACNSDCNANLDGKSHLGNSTICCTDIYDYAPKCPSSGIPHYQYFKSKCKNTYCYAFDDYPSSNSTAVWTCASTLRSDYTITFCP